MAHHGESPLERDSTGKAGPAGRFPHGKIDSKDGGEIAIQITTSEEELVLSFGKAIAWIGFTPEQAHVLAGKLIAWADSVSKVEDFAAMIQKMNDQLAEEREKQKKAFSGHGGAGVDLGEA